MISPRLIDDDDSGATEAGVAGIVLLVVILVDHLEFHDVRLPWLAADADVRPERRIAALLEVIEARNDPHGVEAAQGISGGSGSGKANCHIFHALPEGLRRVVEERDRRSLALGRVTRTAARGHGNQKKGKENDGRARPHGSDSQRSFSSAAQGRSRRAPRAPATRLVPTVAR